MKARVYDQFEEVEQDVTVNAPPVVYKYRTWKNDFHKDVLMKQLLWFPHPFDLEDTLDLRPETIFIEAEFHDVRYYQKILSLIPRAYPELQTKSHQEIAANNQWTRIKENPKIIYQHLHEFQADRGNYDNYGVFSTCMNGLSEEMWNSEYGDYNKGYCIGFKTVWLCDQLDSGFGFVNYDNKPHIHSFLESSDDDVDVFYLKKDVYRYEDEFRFSTVLLEIEESRSKYFTTDIVAEILLGYDMSTEDEREILKIIVDHYPTNLPIYKVEKIKSGALNKARIYP